MNPTPRALAALSNEVGNLRATASGRNSALFRAAAALGNFVGSGELDYEQVYSELYDAAESIGMLRGRERSDSLGTLRRGLTQGMATPRPPSPTWHRNGVGGNRSAAAPPPPPRPPAPPPEYPPLAEVESLWAEALAPTDDAEACSWLRSRAIDPVAITDWDTCRSLRPGASLPRWAHSLLGGWDVSGHRLLIRLFDAEGNFRSLRARSIRGGVAYKELAPSGLSVRGLSMLDGLAIHVLRHGPPDWWTPRDFVICEGAPDFLSHVSLQTDANETGAAVLGLFEGSWTAELAERIPTDAEVFIRDHPDNTGEKHVKRITRDLGERCFIHRINRDKSA